jgi:hypothetical protein
LCIAEIFDDSEIDVMDAELEGAFNTVGSELTKKFSEKYYDGRIRFIKGFCPTDLNLLGEKKYDLIFMDGLHTDEQQLRDLAGLIPFAGAGCVIYLHDVMLLQMEKSWEHIKHNTPGFKGYNVDFTNFGCKALVRGLPIVEEWLSLIDHSPMREFANPVATLKAGIIFQPSQAEQKALLKERP